jgi:hypothetical protein
MLRKSVGIAPYLVFTSVRSSSAMIVAESSVPAPMASSGAGM